MSDGLPPIIIAVGLSSATRHCVQSQQGMNHAAKTAAAMLKSHAFNMAQFSTRSLPVLNLAGPDCSFDTEFEAVTPTSPRDTGMLCMSSVCVRLRSACWHQAHQSHKCPALSPHVLLTCVGMHAAIPWQQRRGHALLQRILQQR